MAVAIRPGGVKASDGLDLSPEAALTVDELPSVGGAHPRAKADLPGSFPLRNSMGVMHGFSSDAVSSHWAFQAEAGS